MFVYNQIGLHRHGSSQIDKSMKCTISHFSQVPSSNLTILTKGIKSLKEHVLVGLLYEPMKENFEEWVGPQGYIHEGDGVAPADDSSRTRLTSAELLKFHIFIVKRKINMDFGNEED